MEKIHIKDLNPDDYDYDLPKERIAQYPVTKRDESRLLVLKEGKISKDVFKNVHDHIPAGSLLVFNNSRVIRARLLFGKDTGAVIEVLCLEPISPPDYESSLTSRAPVEWKCIIGNLKKWKNGIIIINFTCKDNNYILEAEKVKTTGDVSEVRFSWNSPEMCFGEVIEAAGHIPLPPYIDRKDEIEDTINYQTVYSTIKGSVAAPTAGLHFTDHVLGNFSRKGIRSVEITLHVGAGTFQPIKARQVSEHEMHCERFLVTAETIRSLISHQGRTISVGTTSVRTIESLYWLGVKVLDNHRDLFSLSLDQWEAYELRQDVSVGKSLNTLLEIMIRNNLLSLQASTSIMIVPGYKFRITNGLITNFHQPRSTLLLLISAWLGEKWKEVYSYALKNEFRFLSYGDSSLLLNNINNKGLI